MRQLVIVQQEEKKLVHAIGKQLQIFKLKPEMKKPRIALQISSEKGFALLPPSQARAVQTVQIKHTLSD